MTFSVGSKLKCSAWLFDRCLYQTSGYSEYIQVKDNYPKNLKQRIMKSWLLFFYIYIFMDKHLKIPHYVKLRYFQYRFRSKKWNVGRLIEVEEPPKTWQTFEHPSEKNVNSQNWWLNNIRFHRWTAKHWRHCSLGASLWPSGLRHKLCHIITDNTCRIVE